MAMVMQPQARRPFAFFVAILVFGLALAVAAHLPAEAGKITALRYVVYGNALYRIGNLEKAEAAYTQATTLDSENADAWKGLGNVLTMLHRDDEAAKAYARAETTSKAKPQMPSNEEKAKEIEHSETVPNPAPSKAEAADTTSRLAIGVGYPDVRLRLDVAWGLDLEAKGAFGQGQQAYSGRLIWNYWDLGPFKMTLGGEGGMVILDGIDTLNGNGPFGYGFVGMEYPIGPFRLSADIGDAYMSATTSGHSYSTTDIIYNTALYFFIF